MTLIKLLWGRVRNITFGGGSVSTKNWFGGDFLPGNCYCQDQSFGDCLPKSLCTALRDRMWCI